MTVPTAMDCAASSIQNSPLSVNRHPPAPPPLPAAATAASAPDCSPCCSAPSPADSPPACSAALPCCRTSCGNSSSSRPATPMNRPAMPRGERASPNSRAARTATLRGWLSMMTEPRPAVVRCSPSAKKPCRHEQYEQAGRCGVIEAGVHCVSEQRCCLLLDSSTTACQLLSCAAARRMNLHAAAGPTHTCHHSAAAAAATVCCRSCSHCCCCCPPGKLLHPLRQTPAPRPMLLLSWAVAGQWLQPIPAALGQQAAGAWRLASREWCVPSRAAWRSMSTARHSTSSMVGVGGMPHCSLSERLPQNSRTAHALTFIATMLVPQKKKGDTSSAAPSSCISGPPSPEAAAAAAVLGAACAGLPCAADDDAGSSSSLMTHCTSIPVATQSMCWPCPLPFVLVASAGAGGCCWLLGGRLPSSSEM